jgi:response regulator RpfG family c-di-GMP phosphodiesterase
MSTRLLIVDDSEDVILSLRELLSERYQVDTAGNGAEAVRLLRLGRPYSVIISDMHMPGMKGVELLALCATIRPLATRILLTGDASRRVSTEALNVSHCFRVVYKAIPPAELLAIVELAVRQNEQAVMENELLDSTYRGTVKLLLELFSATAPESLEMSVRLQRVVRKFADIMKFPLAWEIEMTAGLARIGMATLPPNVLSKFSEKKRLTSVEQSLVDTIPDIGARLLEAVPRLERVAETIRYQWKHYDGTGLPVDSRNGVLIPLGARVLKIFTDRAWLELDGVPVAEARKKMEERVGVYDPELLAASFLHFPDNIVQDSSIPAMVLMLSATELKPRQTAVMDITTKSGQRIVAAGNRLTAASIQRIRNHRELGNLPGPFCVQELSGTNK